MQAIMKGGRLLVPLEGDAVEVIDPADPRYGELREHAIDDDALNGTPEQDARLAARWRTNYAAITRRTA